MKLLKNKTHSYFLHVYDNLINYISRRYYIEFDKTYSNLNIPQARYPMFFHREPQLFRHI